MLTQRRNTPVVLTAILLACPLMTGCAEAYFELAPQSRLPRWFQLSNGLSRADVSVTMASYVTRSGRSARFKLWDGHGRQLAEVNATMAGLEAHTFTSRSPQGGFDARSYPLYEVMTASDITEVVEHKERGPVIWINDDVHVKAALGVK